MGTTNGSLVGCRIVYDGDSGRKGWHGTIIDHNNRFVVIEYDNGVEQRYSVDAVVGLAPHYKEDFAYIRVVSPTSEPSEPPSRHHYIVKGELGGSPRRCDTYPEAEKLAREAAAASKSGQPYLIYEVVGAYQRSAPPVEQLPLNKRG